MIVTPATVELTSWPIALPMIVFVLVFTVFGLWMILSPDEARAFMDQSLRKSEEWFNLKESAATPRGFPRILGTIFVLLSVVLVVLIVVTVLV